MQGRPGGGRRRGREAGVGDPGLAGRKEGPFSPMENINGDGGSFMAEFIALYFYYRYQFTYQYLTF
jgi:hypothetical protein